MPVKLCLDRPCPEAAVYRGRCTHHARLNEHATHDRDRKRIYNSRRWKLLRRRVLFEQPLCPCGHIATDVDHITAIEHGGNPWARTNLQALCAPCHSRKTNAEQQARPDA